VREADGSVTYWARSWSHSQLWDWLRHR
jgi:hypothetical protein